MGTLFLTFQVKSNMYFFSEENFSSTEKRGEISEKREERGYQSFSKIVVNFFEASQQGQKNIWQSCQFLKKKTRFLEKKKQLVNKKIVSVKSTKSMILVKFSNKGFFQKLLRFENIFKKIVETNVKIKLLLLNQSYKKKYKQKKNVFFVSLKWRKKGHFSCHDFFFLIVHNIQMLISQ